MKQPLLGAAWPDDRPPKDRGDQRLTRGAAERDNKRVRDSPGYDMTFAVIKTGGKQYKVAANDVVKIEKIAGEAGDVVTFDQVLMVGDGAAVTIGAPLVEGALVAGHFVSTDKQRTVLIVKKHRRQHFDRRNGHRQLLSTVRITEILTGGAKPTTVADEKLKARLAAKIAAAAPSVSDVPIAAKPAKKAAKAAPPADETPVPEAAEAAPETKAKAPAKKAAKKAADKPAAEATEKKAPAKKAPAKKAAAADGEKPAKKAARKAAPKADKE
jgi:large subunit ribosomal protein L21